MMYNVLQTVHGKVIVAEDRVSAIGSILGESRTLATLKGAFGPYLRQEALESKLSTQVVI